MVQFSMPIQNGSYVSCTSQAVNTSEQDQNRINSKSDSSYTRAKDDQQNLRC